MSDETFNVLRHPLVLLPVSFVVMWVAAWIGSTLIRPRFALDERSRDDFGVILAASLTLLALVIGFSFSVATGRYDQRKNYEEAEANAIGTEYLRAGLLPAADAANVRALLKRYLDERVLFYLSHGEPELGQINARTAHLQDELWSAVLPAAAAHPTPTVALAVAGMNDVLNSQGYTQSAWWFRIPTAAWALMAMIAIGCNLLVGFGARGAESGRKLLLILPLLLSIGFMLIADIDTPRHGIIRVRPQNLTSLVDSLRSPGP